MIWLNAHYDMASADLEDWTVPPFEGLRQNDRVDGRGAQDMKRVCVQHIAALRYIRQHNPHWQPQRSICLTDVPVEGMSVCVLLKVTP